MTFSIDEKDHKKVTKIITKTIVKLSNQLITIGFDSGIKHLEKFLKECASEIDFENGKPEEVIPILIESFHEGKRRAFKK